MTPRKITALLLAGSILFGLGLVAPSMIVHPAAGSYTGWIRLLAPRFGEPQTVSIAGGISALLDGGEFFVGGILLLFSIIFPLAKFGVLWAAADDLQRGAGPPPRISLISHFAKLSMLDILVLALAVIALKKLPGGTQIEIGPGAAAFTLAVLVSMAAAELIKRRAEQGAAAPPPA